jgi:hypothetical protein
MIPNGRAVPLQPARLSWLGVAAHSRRVRYTYANHLGLYSEEISSTGEQLGNFPRRSATSP